MSIDKKEVKSFWDAQAKKSSSLKLEGISNLEENKELLEKKILLELNKVNSWIGSLEKMCVLDLGSGTGQWAIRFAETADSVIAVEFSEGMQEHAISLSNDMRISNIKFTCCPAQEYLTKDKIDLIWISGLLIYLDDYECNRLLKNCKKMLQSGAKLILRDGTGVLGRHEINSSYSEALKANYSAIYRTSEEYIEMFKMHGFLNIKYENMFEEGSDLNKWPETRLKIYEFMSI